MTARYIDFPKKTCPNVSSPCWIPQAANIIHEEVIHNLPQCNTIDKYSCMLHSIRDWNLDEICIKSCKAETYAISVSKRNINPFSSVNYTLLDWYTVTYYRYIPKFQKGSVWKIYIISFYQSFTQDVLMEMEIYDFNAVVASVGGSLGLFLGFSCYECGKRLIDQIPSGFCHVRSNPTNTSADTEVENYKEENIYYLTL